MAKTKKRARPKAKRPTLRPYNPTAPRFKYQRGFNRAVNRQAQAQIDPLLGDVSSREREAQGAHATRAKEIGGWYGNEGTQAQAGYDRLNSSLQGLLSSNTGLEGDASGALNAALRQQAEGANAEAAKLGVAGPAVDPSFLAASQAYGGANRQGLIGDIAGLLGSSAAGIATTGIRGREAGQAEGDRFNAIQEGLTSERSDIMGRLPGLREQAREQISQEELGRHGQVFQEGLANKQFGLSVRAQRETERTGAAQRQLGRATLREQRRSSKASENLQGATLIENSRQADQNAGIERDKLNQAIKDAKTGGDRDAATLRAQGFNNGVEAIKDFITPGKNEMDPDTNEPNSKYKRNWRDGFYILTRQVGLPVSEALRVLLTFPQFRKEAKSAQGRSKARKRQKAINKVKDQFKDTPKPKGPMKKYPRLTDKFPR